MVCIDNGDLHHHQRNIFIKIALWGSYFYNYANGMKQLNYLLLLLFLKPSLQNYQTLMTAAGMDFREYCKRFF